MRRPSIAYPAGGTWLFFIALLQAAPNTNTASAELTIPYVATRQDVVSDSLWLANVGKEDVIYDLGSGDGRIVIAAVCDRGARRAVGIEIDPKRVAESREKARAAGVAERTEFIQGDLFTNEVQLQIEQRDGRLAATYVDGQRKMPVSDFYDFGGGFYFTILIGREGGNYSSHSLKVDENCGWLIGQGLANEGRVTGQIAFYACSERDRMADLLEAGFGRRVAPGWRDWSPNKAQTP